MYHHAINESVTCFYFVEKNNGNTRTKNGGTAVDAPYGDRDVEV